LGFCKARCVPLFAFARFSGRSAIKNSPTPLSRAVTPPPLQAAQFARGAVSLRAQRSKQYARQARVAATAMMTSMPVAPASLDGFGDHCFKVGGAAYKL
jgi:hypothetical protein